MLRVQDVGELAYGSAVTLANWWDGDRIKKGTLVDKDILKKAGFYTFLVIGLVATVVNLAGWWRRGDAWTERLSHGFIYGVPGFAYSTFTSLRTTTAARGRSDAVAQAQEILRLRQQADAGRSAGGRGAGYQVTDPYEILT